MAEWLTHRIATPATQVRFLFAPPFLCGRNSKVECLVANEIVEGSIPFVRSSAHVPVGDGNRLSTGAEMLGGFESRHGRHS
jgi:hypothetical protein